MLQNFASHTAPLPCGYKCHSEVPAINNKPSFYHVDDFENLVHSVFLTYPSHFS